MRGRWVLAGLIAAFSSSVAASWAMAAPRGVPVGGAPVGTQPGVRATAPQLDEPPIQIETDTTAPRVVSLQSGAGGSSSGIGGWVRQLDGLQSVRVRFSEVVTVPPSAVRLFVGASTPLSLTPTLTPNAAGDELLITLPSAVRSELITLVLDSTITDAAGNLLDGELAATESASLPSGDGIPGGQTVLRFRVLEGDVNRDGVVDGNDLGLVLDRFNTADADADLNVNGLVDADDVGAVVNNFNAALEQDDGTPPALVSITPDPTRPLPGPVSTVSLRFSSPVTLAMANARALQLVKQSVSRSADTVSISPDATTVTFGFTTPLERCDVYRLGLAPTLADTTGTLATPPASVSLSGLIPPVDPTVNATPIVTTTEFFSFSGVAPDAARVRITSPAGSIETPVTNNAFAATIQLPADQLSTVYFTSLSSCGIASPAASRRISRDASPPTVAVDFPSAGAQLTTGTVNVLGRVGDEFSGFVGINVTVNGVTAAVTPRSGNDGTFVASNIPLNASGATTFTVIATDAVGNQRTTTLNVTRFVPTSSDFVMETVSGDGQSAAVLSDLTNPLTVRLKKPDGSPLAGKLVTFDITRSDGQLRSTPTGTPGVNPLKLQVFTDASGLARAYWRLGSDSGSGNNRVSVTSQDLVGTVFFAASATTPTPDAAERIVVGDHNYQKAQAGAQLAQPLRAFVTDGDSGNGVPNVPVTFTIVQGDGMFTNGESAITVPTMGTGHAEVVYFLGTTPGENVIEASFTGNPGLPATFIATGLARNDGQPTTLEGQVLDNAGRPIGGAVMTLKTTVTFAAGPSSVTLGPKPTDVDGRFTFSKADLPAGALDKDLPAGPAKLLADARNPVKLAGVDKPVWSFPYVGYEMLIVEGAVNALPTPIYLPELDPRNEVLYDGTKDVVLKVAGIDGLEFRVKAGSMTRENKTRPSPSDPEVLRLNQVHFDEVPMPLPDGTAFPFAWTLQPKNARFDPPIEVTLPNLAGLPPGATTTIVQWNNDTANFQTMGTARVSPNGAVLVSDIGSGITVAGWGGAAPPPPPTVEESNCSGSRLGRFLRSAARFAVEVGSAIVGVKQWLSAGQSLMAAAEDCIGAWETTKSDGNVTCEEVTSITNCSLSLVGAIEEVVKAVPNPVGLASRADRIRAGITSAATFAQSNGCLSTNASIRTASVVGLLTEFSGKVGEWTGKLSAKKLALSLVQQKIATVNTAIGLRCPGARGAAANGSLTAEQIAEIDRAVQELAAARRAAIDAGLVASALSDTVLPADLIPNVAFVSDSLASNPEIAGCELTLAGFSTTVDEFGGFSFPAIPVRTGLVRAYVVCDGPTGRRYGATDYFRLTEGFSNFPSGPIGLGVTPLALPVRLDVQAARSTVQPGETNPLTVNAVLSDGNIENVTARRQGTVYSQLGLGVVSLSEEGVATALAEGTAFTRVENEGVTAVVRFDVATNTFAVDLTGVIVMPNGTPAAGAAVTSLPFGGSATADAAGSFTFNLTVPAGSTSVRVAASLSSGGSNFTATSDPIAIAPNVIVDAGVLRLQRPYDGPLFPQPVFTTQTNPIGIAHGDLDGDGRPDIAVANWGSGTVSVLRNLGNGTFAARVDYVTGTQPSSVAISDLDGDGRLDLTVTNRGSSTVSVLRNLGSGTFAARLDYATGTQPLFVSIGDLDGDSHPEIVVVNSSVSISVLRNLGNGTIAPRVDYATGSFPGSVAIGDLDGDGYPDLAVSNGGSSTVSVLRNLGNGAFAARIDYATGPNPTSVKIGDLDADGRLDLAATNRSSNSVSVLRNTSSSGGGSISFAARVDYGVGSSPDSVSIGDLDGDNRPELAVVNWGSNTVSVLRNIGNGTFAARVGYRAGANPRDLAIKDLDADGRPDLAVVNYSGNSISVLRNVGGGTFADRFDYAASSSPHWVAIGDLDGDGSADLAVANRGSNTVSVLRNAGNGVFAARADYATGTTPESVAIGDLDGDGRADLAVANWSSNSVSVLRNLGDGAFGARVDYATGNQPYTVAIGDLDGDLRADLAVVNSATFADSVSVLRNLGNGTFASKVDYSTGWNPRWVAIGDLNGDGHPDLAVANSNSNANTVSVLRNLGNGTFAPRLNFPSGSAPTAVAIGDLDGDGRFDLAVANSGTNTVSVLRNTSSGGDTVAFANRVAFATGSSPYSVDIDDLDGDGRADLAVSNRFGNSVSVLRGLGNGAFAERIDYATGNNPETAAIGDLNADGRLDLAVANWGGNTVSVLLNQSGTARRGPASLDVDDISPVLRGTQRVVFDADRSLPGGLLSGSLIDPASNTTDLGRVVRGNVGGSAGSSGGANTPAGRAATTSLSSSRRDGSDAAAKKAADPSLAIDGIVPGQVIAALGTLGGGQTFVNAVTRFAGTQGLTTLAIGWSETAQGWREPFLWTKATGIRPLREFVHPRDAAMLPLGSSEAVAIDAVGRVTVRVSRPGVESAPAVTVRTRLTPSSRADLDTDGTVTLRDVLLFRNAAAAAGRGSIAADRRRVVLDLNLDGVFDAADVAVMENLAARR